MLFQEYRWQLKWFRIRMCKNIKSFEYSNQNNGVTELTINRQTVEEFKDHYLVSDLNLNSNSVNNVHRYIYKTSITKIEYKF